MKPSLDRSRLNRMTVPAALTAVVLLILVFGSAYAAEKKTDYPPDISFSADQDGLKALRTLLKGKTASVKDWRRSWQELPGGGNGVLVAVSPHDVNNKEREPLLSWIKAGNRLIYIAWEPPSTLHIPGLSAEGGTAPDNRPGESVRIARHGDNSANGAQLSAAAPFSTKRLSKASGAEAIFSDDRGVLAARYPYGQGDVTVILTPEWLRNSQILQQDHFELLWPVLLEAAGGRNVWFDEFHHGYRAKPGLLEVYPAWMLAAYAEVALAVLLWLWRKGKRFGPVHTPREWVVLRGDETLKAVAGWYRRRRLMADAIMEQEQYLRKLLSERYGVRTTAAPAELVQAVRMNAGDEAAGKLKSLLGRLQELRKGKRYASKSFLADSAAMAEIGRAVEQRGDADNGTVH